MFSGTIRQFIAASSACIGAFATGCTFAWSAPVTKDLLSPDSLIPMTSDEMSWVVAIIELGNYLSPIPAGYLVDKIGRKWSLLLTGPINIISWIIAMYSRSVLGLYVMRTLQGFAMAAIYVISPMYLGEIAETRIRGTIGTLFQISTHLGILYTYVLGSELSYMNYTIASLLVPIVFTVTFMFMPESPYYLVSKGNHVKAMKSLTWLRSKTTQELNDELKMIEESIKKPVERTNFKEFFGKSNIKAFITIVFIIIFRSFTGLQSVIAYANTVFSSTNTFIEPKYVSILFAFILLVSIFPSTYFIDKAGRRILFITSSLGCAVSSLVACTYFYLTINLKYEIPYANWISFVSISSLGVFFNLGFGPLFTPLVSEYFSSSMKAISGTILNIFCTTLGLISYKLFYLLQEHVGVYSNFLFGFISCTISTIYLYFFLLETKGKTFIEIQNMFKNGETKQNGNIQDQRIKFGMRSKKENIPI